MLADMVAAEVNMMYSAFTELGVVREMDGAAGAK